MYCENQPRHFLDYSFSQASKYISKEWIVYSPTKKNKPVSK